MLTPEDIKNIIQAQKAVFATKEDFSRLSVIVVDTKQGLEELKDDVGGLRESLQQLIISVDKLTKAVTGLRTEYFAISEKINRHEHWIRQIADKLGVKLDY